ncbi:MAG: hypothetical protein H9W82_12285 [Lactobacillus sp.]|nr:hypothetical protein [Lactobacillus sp.]
MNFTQEVMVLGITRYNFTNDNNEEVKGTAVHYYDVAGTNEENRYGVLPSKANLPYESYDSLKGHVYPTRGLATVTLDLQRQKMKVTAFDFSDKK